MKPRKTWPIGDLPAIDEWSVDAACAELDPKRLVVLAGAGVSVDGLSALPTARDFLKALYEKALPEEFDWSRLILSDLGPRFELVLDILQAHFDPELKILNAFRSDEPNHNHHCLAALARQGSLILTTNFDVLVEKALAETGDFRSAFDPKHFESWPLPDAPDYLPTIWHLHGVIEDPKNRERRPETIVASIRDVWRSRHLFRLEASKGRFMARALEERDLLVVGYSGSDDYDIMPALVNVVSKRRMIWIEHSVFNPADGPEPGVQVLTFEGDCWYKASALNAIAEMLDQEKRLPDGVGVLKYKSGHVLQILSGVHDPKDPIENGPGPLPPPSMMNSPLEEVEEWLFQQSDFGGFRLRLGLISWKEKHLSTTAGKYLFALKLCEATDLRHEKDKLLALLEEEAPLCGEANDALRRDVAGGMYSAWIVSNVKGNLPDGLLPYLHEFFTQMLVALGVAEMQLEVADYYFQLGSSPEHLSSAEEAAREALSMALEESNPAAAARASLLLARIAERFGRYRAEVMPLYEDASKAAYDSGSPALVASARGEFGIYLWTKFVAEAPQRDADLEKVAQMARLPVAPLAEAFRIHAEQGNLHALMIVAGNLAECLEIWEDHAWRSLRAHCIVLFSAVRIDDVNAQQLATERVRGAASRHLPELELSQLEGEELAMSIIARLDEIPESLI